MIRKLILLIKIHAVVVIVFLVTRCASIFGNNNRTITINSEPQGANVYISNINYGATSLVVELPTYIWNGTLVTLKN